LPRGYAGLIDTAFDRDLLELHKPVLRYDRQYDYRVSSVAGMVENAGNLLVSSGGELIASVGADPVVTLELLGAYPDERDIHELDSLCQAPNVQGDARRMEGDPRYDGVLYGRVIEGKGGRKWLQYWWWFYFNPKNLLGFGKHEGDWEMIQIELDEQGKPDVLTYAQHAHGEGRKANHVEWKERDGGLHPVVYVAPLSHASYFEAQTQPYPGGIDHPYGDGPEAWLPVEPFGAWNDWPGHWGSREHALLGGRIGNPPRGPAHQGGKWKNPATFQAKRFPWKFRRFAGRALRFLGTPFYPLEPKLDVRVDGKRCTVEYRLRQRPWRRSRHLLLTVHDGERVVASRTVVCARRADKEVFRLLEEPSAPEVWGSTWNRVRQRSGLTQAKPARTPT
jgi:hypothetical protein